MLRACVQELVARASACIADGDILTTAVRRHQVTREAARARWPALTRGAPLAALGAHAVCRGHRFCPPNCYFAVRAMPAFAGRCSLNAHTVAGVRRSESSPASATSTAFPLGWCVGQPCRAEFSSHLHIYVTRLVQGKNSTQGKQRRLLSELQTHAQLSGTCTANRCASRCIASSTS